MCCCLDRCPSICTACIISPLLAGKSPSCSPLKRLKQSEREGHPSDAADQANPVHVDSDDAELARKLHEQLNGPDSPGAAPITRHMGRVRKAPVFYKPEVMLPVSVTVQACLSCCTLAAFCTLYVTCHCFFTCRYVQGLQGSFLVCGWQLVQGCLMQSATFLHSGWHSIVCCMRPLGIRLDTSAGVSATMLF